MCLYGNAKSIYVSFLRNFSVTILLVSDYINPFKKLLAEKKVQGEKLNNIQFMLLALYASCNTNMTDNSTQVFNKNVPTQESDYTVSEQIEDISSALVIVNGCLSQTDNEVQFLNESVINENVSINLE